MGWSNYFRKKVLDRQWGSTAFSSPALHLALFTTIPNAAGANGAEPDIDRVAIANSSAEWPAATGTGVKANANNLVFDAAVSALGTIIGIGLYDVAVGEDQTFTTTHGTDTINLTAHGYSDGDVVMMSNSAGALPAGYSAATPYYVRDSSADAFKVADTPGGSAVAISDNGTGTHTVWEVGNLLATCSIPATNVPAGVSFSIPAGALQLTLANGSDYTNKRMLDYLFGSQAFAVPGTAYFALFTTAPDSAGADGVEVSGGNYARKDYTNTTGSGNFADATLGVNSKSNLNAITFATPNADWGTVVAVGVYDAAVGGNLLWVDTIPSAVVEDGNPYVIAAGALTISLN